MELSHLISFFKMLYFNEMQVLGNHSVYFVVNSSDS